MSQPVKISDELILDARLTAEFAERSIAGQIEFWRNSAVLSSRCSKAPAPRAPAGWRDRAAFRVPDLGRFGCGAAAGRRIPRVEAVSPL